MLLRGFLFLLLALLPYLGLPASQDVRAAVPVPVEGAGGGAALPRRITVVMDYNYPPYVFADGEGRMQGILIDQWRLWEQKTGIQVEIHTMPWAIALQRMFDGEFDVIDTIFINQARLARLEFTPPYQQIEVPIFFDRQIAGISDLGSLRGFQVGVKDGDAAVDLLRREGIDTLRTFGSYEDVLIAARERKISVFVVDAPPAFYYLHKFGIHDSFRHSAPLNVGAFHRAVVRGNTRMRLLVEQGFAKITPSELHAIDEKWFGRESFSMRSLRWLLPAMGAALALLAGLFAWNTLLRRAVQRRVEQLRASEERLRRTEEQFRQAQKLQAVGQLAGGVAHDFNNILAAVLLRLGLMRENPGLDEDTRQSLLELEKQVQRGTVLTRQLLAYSRQQIMETRVLGLNEVIGGLVEMLHRLLGENIGIVQRLDPRLPPVRADRGMLEQVIVNLAVNARDAMPRGGNLILETSLHDLSPAEAADRPGAKAGLHVRLAVVDNGSGIDPAIRHRIFEPFFTTKDVGKGTGLGLSTVYGIVSQHRGWVEVESEVGVGSRFHVFLPVCTEAPDAGAQSHAAAPELPRGRNETILLVEDDAAVRNAVGTGLRRHGYKVIEAVNGPEAIRLWERMHEEIDLLFTDMVMPESLTGIDIASQFLAEKPTLPVIVCSGYNQSDAAALAVGPRPIVFLQKPIDWPLLLTTVRRCLDARS